jgi:hypothetical protein
MKKRKYLEARSLCSLILAMAAMAITPGAGADEIPVTVTFDVAGCPIGVSPMTVRVEKARGDRVKWLAVNEDGEEYKGGFSIIFDPFNGGRRLTTSNKSSLRSPPVDNSIPPDVNIDYKYSVLGRNCGTPYDPFIRVL